PAPVAWDCAIRPRRSPRVKRLAAILASSAALSACTTVGPDYAPVLPDAAAQGSALHASSDAAFTPETPPGDWWRLYDDARLDAFVAKALEANNDLRIAAANLARARAVLREARTGQLPTTTLSGGASYGRQSGAAQAEANALPDGELYDAGLDVGYQVDLFGRVRRAVEASEADLGAVQAAYDLTRITVVAETVRAYADACNAGRRLTAARRSVELPEQTRAEIPTLETLQQTALYRLAVLTGRPPAEFPREHAACASALQLDRPIPVGDGAALLNRRPDVRAAERRLAAATARIGVATADL